MKLALIVVGLCSVLATGLIAGFMYGDAQHADCVPYQYTAATEENAPKWTDVTVACFTVVLTIATVLMWWAMHMQLQETKRNTNTLIASERAHLTIPIRSVLRGEDRESVIYQIINLGRTPAEIIAGEDWAEWLQDGSQNPHAKNERQPWRREFIGAGQSVDCDVVIANRPASTNSRLVLFVRIQYRTLGTIDVAQYVGTHVPPAPIFAPIDMDEPLPV